MTNRNFILLVIVLVIITGGVLFYLFSYKTTAPADQGEGTNFLSEFNPFGSKKSAPQEKPTEVPTYATPEEAAEMTSNLKAVSDMPVAGYGLFQKERYKEVSELVETTSKKPTPPATEFVSAVRYVARTDGNIYQTFADHIDQRKFSSTVVPKVYEAYLGNKAQSVIMRNLAADEITVQTFLGSLPKEVLGADNENNEVKGTFLPENIKDLALSQDFSKVFYLSPTTGGVSGIVLNFVDGKKSSVFDSAFTEWLPQWPNAKMITLTTKPSGLVPGHMYIVDPAVKKLTRVLGDIAGLTTLTSPNGKLVAYSGTDLSLQLYDIATKTSRSLGLRTLPEKCVWDSGSANLYCAAPKTTDGGIYPDDWYQGKVSFTDQIWKINIVTGTTEIILDPVVAGGGEIDGIKLGLDQEEKYLFFVNKKDSYLWEFSLSN